jgi:hypothetical protein
VSNEPNGAATAQPQQTQALTPYQARAIELREHIATDTAPRAIVPRTFAEAQAFASAIAHSSLVPEALKERAPDILMIVLAGAELGIAPIRSLSMFHVIEGVPKLSSEALGAIVTASPVCEYLEPRELSASRVVFAAKRRGRPEVTIEFTDADVKAANLDRPSRSGAPSNHVKFPLDMKVARARSKICKFVFPDIAAGIVTKEEAEDLRHSREFEPPTRAAEFTAPPPPSTPPAPPPASSSSAPAGKAAKSTAKKAAPIDTTATEKPSAIPAGSNTSPTTTDIGKPPTAEEAAAAREDAFAKARAAAPGGEPPRPHTPPPLTEDPVVPANTEDTTIPATSDAVDPGAALPASDEDGFGGDEPPPAAARTIEAFEKLVDAAVAAKDADRLATIKADWIPWSKDESPTGGKAHAHRMRDKFASARAALGIK